MLWNHYLSYYFGGAFFANAIPHFVSGTLGRAFQSPFATPRGQGMSTSTLNILWGAFNFVMAYLLILQVGTFDLHNVVHAATFGLGSLSSGLYSAQWFGRFNGGNTAN